MYMIIEANEHVQWSYTQVRRSKPLMLTLQDSAMQVGVAVANPGEHTRMHAIVAHRPSAAPTTLRRILLALATSGSSAMMRR